MDLTLKKQLEQLSLLQRAGKWDEAFRLAQTLLQSNPQDLRLLNELGHMALSQGRAQETLDWLGRSLHLSPAQFQPLSDYGTALGLLGRFDLALEALNRAMTLKQDDAPVHYNRGLVFERLNRPHEALAAYGRALELDPGLSPAHVNQGNLLKGFNQLEEALTAYDLALAADELNSDAHNNRAAVLVELGRFEEALQSFDRAIARYPGFAMAYKNKAQLLLLLGKYEEGWPLYEWRWKADLQGEYRGFPHPLWLGREPLKDQVLLIQAEQGFGDILQFCRYLPLLKDLASKVVFEVPKPVFSLLATLPGGATVVEKGKPLPAFDHYCPLLSLPLALRTTLATIPSGGPYLFTDPLKRNVWQKHLGPKQKPRIGLAWSGKEQYIHDAKRSLALELLRPLLELPLEFHSLQKEYRPKDEALLAGLPQIRDHRADLEDFSDTAALIEEMDLVVCADTSVAHLAGALGKPFWVLLPSIPNCRWLLDRPDSPWYPTARIFRQTTPSVWEPVIRQVMSALGENMKTMAP